MKKFLLLICTFLCLFVTLERDNISLVLANRIGDMRYYIGADEAIANYNEAVSLIDNKQYNEAKSLIQPILNTKSLVNPADVYELYGDLVYETHGSTGDVAIFYHRSLEYIDTPRVRTKLALLDQIQLPREKTETGATNTGSIAVPDDQTGALMRETRRQELTGSGVGRRESLDPYAGMTPPEDIISRTLQLLSTGSASVRDW
jgi:hypothetical protein